MKERINVMEKGQGVLKAMYGLGAYLVKSPRKIPIEHGNVPDEVYNIAMDEFTEQELIDRTVGVIIINSCNRINIALGTAVADYNI